MTGYELISADSHVIEPADLFEKRLPAGLRDRAPQLRSWNGGSAWMVGGADPVPLPPSVASGSGYRIVREGEDAPRAAVPFEEVLPGLYDPVERIKMQDADSVDAEVLYPFPALWDAIKRIDDAELNLGCVRAYNDWIAEFSSHRPDRLIGVGKIPSGSREDAEAELARCIDDLHLKGVVLDTWPGGRPMPADPSEDRFWARVNEAEVPVSIHYALGLDSVTAPPAGIEPWGGSESSHGLNPPLDGTATPLLRAGLFDRYPDVRVVFAHGDAGWTFHWLEFMDDMYIRGRHLESRQLPFTDPDSLPSEYVRRHFWFTFQQDRYTVTNRHLLGTNHLLWSSHLPLDAADWPDNRQQAMRVTEELPAEDLRVLLAENTARLYQLPGYEDGFASTGSETFEKLVHI